MATVAFVVSELYPFTAGGIGRLTHNILQREAERRAHDLHVLVPAHLDIDAARFRDVFGDRATLHAFAVPARPWLPIGRRSKRAWRESLAVRHVLQSLVRKGVALDLVEFADYAGWGHATIENPGRWLRHVRTAVRLHATRDVLSVFDGSAQDAEGQYTVQQERTAIAGADFRIAHVPAVTRYMQQRYFGTQNAEAIITEFPPVVWPQARNRSPIRAKSDADFLFLSKLEGIKNPALFIAGCSELFRRHPEHRGKAIFACHAFDASYAAHIRSLVPEDMATRFVFRPPFAPTEWNTQVSAQIVIIPSLFETLNLLAYEAIAAGAVVCVNEACVAFGNDSPLVDSDNCLKFRPTAGELADAIERALTPNVELRRLLPAAEIPYWDRLHDHEARVVTT